MMKTLIGLVTKRTIRKNTRATLFFFGSFNKYRSETRISHKTTPNKWETPLQQLLWKHLNQGAATSSSPKA